MVDDAGIRSTPMSVNHATAVATSMKSPANAVPMVSTSLTNNLPRALVRRICVRMKALNASGRENQNEGQHYQAGKEFISS
jgi:hypothetical protein